MLKTVRAIEEGNYAETGQQQFSDLKRAPKIFTEDCRIDWNLDSVSINNKIRGLSPYPAAFTTFNGRHLKIFSPQIISLQHQLDPGTVSTDGKTFLHFAAKDGFIEVMEVQPEGKRRMTIEEFLRGSRIIP